MRQLVYGAPSADIRTVVVDGRVVVRDGVAVGIDLASLTRDAAAHTAASLAGERSNDAEELEAMVAEMYRQVEAAELEVDSYLRS